jgi:heterotetrameric sarcosine oxidase gamma subunit
MAENDIQLTRVRELAIVRYREVGSPAPPELELPPRGQSKIVNGFECMWRSPSVWWVKSRTQNAKDIIAWLARPDFAIDYSDAVATFLLTGGLARRALSAGCPVDLRRHAFPAGSVAATRFELFDIVLHACRDETFDVHVARSYAEDAERRLGDVIGSLQCNN